MGKEIICKRIEVAHVDEFVFDEDNPDALVPKSDSIWKDIFPVVKITYSSDDENTDSGLKNNETVTVVADYEYLSFLKNNLKLYILKLYTQDSTFIVGSLRYPAFKTISNNKNRGTATFKRKSEN